MLFDTTPYSSTQKSHFRDFEIDLDESYVTEKPELDTEVLHKTDTSVPCGLGGSHQEQRHQEDVLGSYVTEFPLPNGKTLHKTIEGLPRSEQIKLRNWLDKLLQELEVEDIPKNKNREVIKRERIGSIVYQLEKVKCGKSNCKSCPHGPYWYSYQRINNRIVSKYIGKNRKEV